MSVYKSKRGESSVQFIETARQLEAHLRVLHEGTEAVRAVSDGTHHGAEQRGA